MTDSTIIHRARILIVDDCCDTAGLLCELLTLKGYEQVSWATDADAVRSLHMANHYGLILLDMHMPNLGGLDVMRHLHTTEPDYYVPVIAISGDRRYRTVAMEAGACAFLLKPFSHKEVEATICNVLSTRYAYMSRFVMSV
ncbi:MAG: diguanylate cyclase [Herminiimonas sp.]|nr:diguanylate cyclase [Herminiimonas sp.]